MILSACSPYFQSILKAVSSPHPVIVMPHDVQVNVTLSLTTPRHSVCVQHEEMMSIVDFMYYGEVPIPVNEISRFLTVAEHFQVRGLVEDVPKVGAVSGVARPRLEASGEASGEAGSYQPLGSYQPPGLVCPNCRIICPDGPQGLKAHMAQCGQERPVLQVAPSRQGGGLASRGRGGQVHHLRGRPGGQARRGREMFKPSHGESSRPAMPRTAPRRGQGVVEGRPNLREIGQKLGLAVSITSVAGQSSHGSHASHTSHTSHTSHNDIQEPDVKQEPGNDAGEEISPVL